MLLAAPAMTAELQFPHLAGNAEFIRSASLFKPVASVNDSPICGPLLAEARNSFLDGTVFVLTDMPGFGELSGDEYDAPRYTLTMIGLRLDVEARRHPGCGGACETQSMSFRSAADPVIRTEALDGWSIQTNGTDWYAIGSSSETIAAYHLNSTVPTKVCHVDFGVPEFGKPEDEDFRAVLPAIESFQKAIGGVRRDAGECGSLRSASRLAGYSDLAVRSLVFRPWALEGLIPSEDFEAWSLNGLSEFDAIRTLKQQFLTTRDALATFYLRKGYARSAADSTVLATRALSGALAQSFWFPPAESFDDEGSSQAAVRNRTRLRRALLERRPMSEIKALSLDQADVDLLYPVYSDPLLSLAIRHPEALEYLLKRGLKPDRTNPFGKTPLMFAAQYDEPRAVEILLAHGADPNAMTSRPGDNCFYTLEFAHATPLHYAARYASPPTIEKLIGGGALTFVEGSSARRYNKGTGYPLDWFRERREAPVASAEAFERLFALSDAAAREQTARELRQEATRKYRARQAEAAYRDLRNALSVTPDDAAALSDFALIALRAGHVGESLQAAARVRGLTQDPALLGNAWFNTGLACMQQQGRGSYNGFHFCTDGEVYPFLQAWRAMPSAARESKIAESLAQSRANSCIADNAGVRRQYWFTPATEYSRTHRHFVRIFVRHPKNSPPPARAITWEQESTTRSPRVQSFSSSFVETYELGAFAVSVLTIDDWPPKGMLLEGKPCEPRNLVSDSP